MCAPNNASCTRALVHPPSRRSTLSFFLGRMRIESSPSVELRKLLYREIRILQLLIPSSSRRRPDWMARTAREPVKQPRRHPQADDLGPSAGRRPWAIRKQTTLGHPQASEDDHGPSSDDHGPSADDLGPSAGKRRRPRAILRQPGRRPQATTGHPQADDHGPSADDHVVSYNCTRCRTCTLSRSQSTKSNSSRASISFNFASIWSVKEHDITKDGCRRRNQIEAGLKQARTGRGHQRKRHGPP